MARDESRQEGADERGNPQGSGDATAEPITVTTDDPTIESAVEHVADWRIHPDSTQSLETTQVHESNPLYVVGVRKVVQEDQKANGKENRGDQQEKTGGDKQGKRGAEQQSQKGGGDKSTTGGEQEGAGRKEDNDNGNGRSTEGGKAGGGQKSRQQQQQPSMMKSLLMTAGIASVCGLVGAFGYSYFAGSSSGKNSSQHGQGESKSKSGSGPSSKKSGGGESQQGSNESKQNKSGPSSNFALMATAEIGTISHQLVDLIGARRPAG